MKAACNGLLEQKKLHCGTLHYTRTYKQNTLALQKVYDNTIDSSQPKKVGLQRRSRIFSVVGIVKGC